MSSIYVHWPFCPYRCAFCPFIALAGHDHFMERYHDALKTEIVNFFNSRLTESIETIYFGGGTPSTYPLNLLLDTFGTLEKITTINADTEITIEVNPGTASDVHLETWSQLGVNRLSIGVQSLNETILNNLNRKQKTEDVITIVNKAASIFKTVSIDLILGLPGVTVKDWKDTIKYIVKLPINHCSIYFLMIHEQTPLYFSVQKKAVQLPPDDEIVDLYYWTIEYLHRFGLSQYELSSFSKFGHESKHNRIYWQRKPFKGFGLGAWSFDGKARMHNEKNLLSYLQGVENNGDVIVFKESLSEKQQWLEKLMLGLRQMNGVRLSTLLQSLTAQEQNDFCERIALCKERNLIHGDEIIALTPRAFVLEHEVIRLLTS